MYHVKYVPEALTELSEFALQFDAYAPLLGDLVIAHWQHALRRILLFPNSSSEFYRSTRKVLIRPYHLHVIYRVVGTEVHILMAYDARRDPDVIRGILDTRLDDE